MSHADFDGPIADRMEALASQLRKASRVLLDEIADLEAENARLKDVLALYEQHPEMHWRAPEPPAVTT